MGSTGSTGERDMGRLLAGMAPEWTPGEFVFVVSPSPGVPPGLHPVVTVAEDEGLTLVLPRSEADGAGLDYAYVAARITLRVHSDLAAVGLTAAVSAQLATGGISCNVVAGYHHDHLFVPADRAADALTLLRALTDPA
ncbi:MAG TPA: ACT domain-containing protein [Pseudonocardia sp.]|nr:ACT domain-containing protein [Pseudonocardia sp.]